MIEKQPAHLGEKPGKKIVMAKKMPSVKSLPKKLYAIWGGSNHSPYVDISEEAGPHVEADDTTVVGVYELAGFVTVTKKTVVSPLAAARK